MKPRPLQVVLDEMFSRNKHSGFYSEPEINYLDARIRGIKLSLLCKHPDFPNQEN